MTTAAATSPVVRRTQAERTARTRSLLLDAALDCLCEHGYAGTTTTIVSERAGVSRGAQLHHFPTRANLVAAAVEHLFAEMTSSYRRAFAALDPDGDRLDEAVKLLWSMFTHDRFGAVVEIYTAARTDEQLHAALLPVAERHRMNVRALAHEYFPEAAAAGPAFDHLLAMLTDAMHGMVVSQTVFRQSADSGAELDVLQRVARVLFEDLLGDGKGREDA